MFGKIKLTVMSLSSLGADRNRGQNEGSAQEGNLSRSIPSAHSSSPIGSQDNPIELADDNDYDSDNDTCNGLITPPKNIISSPNNNNICNKSPAEHVKSSIKFIPEYKLNQFSPIKTVPRIISRNFERHSKNMAQAQQSPPITGNTIASTGPLKTYGRPSTSNSPIVNASSATKLTVTNVSKYTVPSISSKSSSTTSELSAQCIISATANSNLLKKTVATSEAQRVYLACTSSEDTSAAQKMPTLKSSPTCSPTGLNNAVSATSCANATSKSSVGDGDNHGLVKESLPQQRGSASRQRVTDACNTLSTIHRTNPIPSASVATLQDTHSSPIARTTEATADSSLSAMPKNRYGSHVITPTSASYATQARAEPECPPPPNPISSSTPPRSNPIVEMSGLEGQSNTSDATNKSSVQANQSQTNDITQSNTSATKTFVAGLRMKSRPKKKGHMMGPSTTPPIPEAEYNNISGNYIGEKNIVSKEDIAVETKDAPKQNIPGDQESKDAQESIPIPDSNKLPKPFSWDLYLKLVPAKVAPKEAFNQPPIFPKNNFKLGMKLEVRDPRNSFGWGLATVVGIEGLYLRLRFDNTDKSNDIYELVDSDRIRSVGSTSEHLLAPVNFKGNIAYYSKFVEKVLSYPDTIIAPPEYFPPKPKEPKQNLFEVGMKLEAVDIKNRDYVCPATIGAVEGNSVRIIFDGWRGSFDYSCDFKSRELFPINWCRDTGHYLLPPNGWEGLVESNGLKGLLAPDFNRLSQSSNGKQTPTHRANNTPGRLQKPPSSRLSGGTVPKIRMNHKSKSKQNSSAPSSVSPKTAPRRQAGLASPSKGCSSNDKASSKTTPETPKESTRPDSLGSEFKSPPSVKEDSKSPVFSPPPFQCSRSMPYTEWKAYEQDVKNFIENQKKESRRSPLRDGNDENFGYLMENGDDNKEESHHESDQQTVIEKSSFNDPSLTSNQSSDSMVQNDGDLTDPPPKKFKPSTDPSYEFMDNVCELINSKPSKIVDWTVRDIVDLISTDEALTKFSTVFTENEIDGKAFILLTKDILLKHMGFKIGPYLKIADLIERAKRLK